MRNTRLVARAAPQLPATVAGGSDPCASLAVAGQPGADHGLWSPARWQARAAATPKATSPAHTITKVAVYIVKPASQDEYFTAIRTMKKSWFHIVTYPPERVGAGTGG